MLKLIIFFLFFLGGKSVIGQSSVSISHLKGVAYIDLQFWNQNSIKKTTCAQNIIDALDETLTEIFSKNEFWTYKGLIRIFDEIDNSEESFSIFNIVPMLKTDHEGKKRLKLIGQIKKSNSSYNQIISNNLSIPEDSCSLQYIKGHLIRILEKEIAEGVFNQQRNLDALLENILHCFGNLVIDDKLDCEYSSFLQLTREYINGVISKLRNEGAKLSPSDSLILDKNAREIEELVGVFEQQILVDSFEKDFDKIKEKFYRIGDLNKIEKCNKLKELLDVLQKISDLYFLLSESLKKCILLDKNFKEYIENTFEDFKSAQKVKTELCEEWCEYCNFKKSP